MAGHAAAKLTGGRRKRSVRKVSRKGRKSVRKSVRKSRKVSRKSRRTRRRGGSSLGRLSGSNDLGF